MLGWACGHRGPNQGLETKMKKALLSKPVEWADAMSDTFGRFLPSKKNVASLSRKNSSPELGEYATGADGSGFGIAEQVWDDSNSEKDGRESWDTQGPDTSSLSAFLYNLMSCTDDSSKGEDKQALKFSRSGSESRAYFARSGNHSTPSSPFRQRGELCNAGEAEEQGSAHRGDCCYADGLLVTQNVKDTTPRPRRKQFPSISVDRLPSMSDHSLLLSDELRCYIHPALPSLVKGRRWILLYSTNKHGMSLLTLYRNSNMATGPCLLVAGDKEGAVFGGLITSPLTPTQQKKYEGSSDSFVFSTVSGQPTIFHPTGVNRYFVLVTPEALSCGGGSHFALHLDSELLNGSSGACETYGNPCLAHAEEFVLKHVELWGFEHTHRPSALSEPTHPLMSW